MTTTILDQVKESLANYRPRSQREFVALQISHRLSDEQALARYIRAAQDHSKETLLKAARLAAKRAEETGQPVTKILFELLEQFGKEVGV